MEGKVIAIKGVSEETQKKLRLYAAMIGGQHAEALDKALTIAIEQGK